MDPRVVWVVVAILVAAVIVAFAWRRQRSERLRARFGPEYERVVDEVGDVRRAEGTLEARAKRIEKLHIRPLVPRDADRFAGSWRAIQARFVEDPKAAVTEADRVIGEVMEARGYPLGDFDQRAADISVDHPHVVTHYRAARDIALRHAKGNATTEDMRQAMIHYRALFQELLAKAEPAAGASAPAPSKDELTRRH